jgi:hypothetical protein
VLPVLGWKVWTSDALFNSVEHQAGEIPADVQVIMYYHPDGYRTTDHGLDFYELDGVTLVGKEMPIDEYLAILDRAMHDMEPPQ